MKFSRQRMSKGFTLIELMIVVAIIGILAAVAIPKFADLVTKSKEAAVKGNLGAVRSAVSIYYGDTEGVYPSNLFDGLTTGSRYLPSGSVGSFTIPNVGTNPGHDCSQTTAAQILQATAMPAGSDAAGLFYYNGGTEIGDLVVRCSHNDTKGSVWTSY
jgi:prepilin-type N-terminal cleavage/methylation domain-containing protein